MKRKKRMKISGIGKKMLTVFMVLLSVTGIALFLSSTAVYKNLFDRLSQVYLSDITNQTTNNLEAVLEDIEDIHVQILASPVVQEQLRYTNREKMDTFSIRNVNQILEKELATSVLLNPHISSANIVSKTGIVYSITNLDGGEVVSAFSEEEIYEANGTTLWKLVGEEQEVCTAKAILDLNTMMPIGYTNIVFKQSYFSDIVRDNSTEFSSYAYVVDEDGLIVSTSNQQFLGRPFPIDLEELKNGNNFQYDSLNEEYAHYYLGNKMENHWVLIQTVSVREINKNIYQNVENTGILLLIILVVGFFLTRTATWHIVQPTRKLVAGMEQFGNGDLSQRVEVTTRDEIGQIASEYNRMADNIETLIEQVYKMEITQKQAEIDFLCMQINPHFLYNTLDTISWMAISAQNTEISEMTIALADLLRAMVKSDRFVTVEEEMRTVQDYLYIQKQRFGDKITAEYEVDKEANPCRIPNFILQPLIENGIIHGLEPKLEKGTLRIEIHMEEEKLMFRVMDDGVGMTEEEVQQLLEMCETNDTSHNIGLKNVYRRLILCYGEQSRIQIFSQKNVGTRIEFCLPAEFTETPRVDYQML